MAYSRYYVYTLAYPDGRIFYVGKGQGDRIHQHEKEARQYCDPQAVRYLPQESAKISVIKEIWASGGKVIKTKVFETDNEQEANEHEQQVIAQCDKRFLTNRTKGGGPQFSKRDPYARLKSLRPFFYSPQEAIETLGVSSTVWGRLVLAGIVQLATVEGCSLPVLGRKAIDKLAAEIQDGTYPIDVWEDTIIQEPLPLWDDQTYEEQTKKEYHLSKIEIQREVTEFVLSTAQEAFATPCFLIGSYEAEAQQQTQFESVWEVYIRVDEEKYLYTVRLQQHQYVIINIQQMDSKLPL